MILQKEVIFNNEVEDRCSGNSFTAFFHHCPITSLTFYQEIHISLELPKSNKQATYIACF